MAKAWQVKEAEVNESYWEQISSRNCNHFPAVTVVTPDIMPLSAKMFESHWQNTSCLQSRTSYPCCGTDSPNPTDNSKGDE